FFQSGMIRIGSRKESSRNASRRKISSHLSVEKKLSGGNNFPSSSSPSEMKHREARISVRREQYYGSLELLVSVDPGGRIRNVGRFRLEPSSDLHYDASAPSTSPVIVENPQEETRWYWKYFLGNEHQNFAGIDPSTKSPFFMSILVEEESEGNRMCRAILWTAEGPRRLCVPAYTGSSNKAITAKSILQHFPGMSDYNRSLKEIVSAKLQKDLIVLEDQEGGANCKFGVIYALGNQVSDTQMLSNEHGDGNFARFVKLLGQRIELQDWGSYRGGLDTTTNSTGRESVYTVFAGHEIMFHVSTMLPYSKDNKQQIERKRHVGNDIVNIVFESGGNPENPNFSPTMMKSHFTHVFAVVTYDEKIECYRLWVFSEETVPAFGPALPRPNIFHDPQKFREFLLTKLINAEKAAFQAKVFIEKRKQTVDALLKDIYIDHLKEVNKGFHKVTDIVIRKLRSPSKKESSTEGVDFCKYGELIKLEKMLSGDVNDMVQVASIRSKQPWEPRMIFENTLAWEVIDSDTWGSTSIVVATEDTGVILLSTGLSVPIFEANARIHQLAVREHFGLFLARIDKGKESSLIVFALADLRLAVQTGNLIMRKTCIEHRIPSSKGCHLFETSDANGLRLNIVLCIGKNMILLRWAFGPLGRIRAGTDLTNNFTQLKNISLCDEVTAISVFERGVIHSTVRVAAFVRNGIAVVDFSSGTVEYLSCDVPKTPITAIYATSDGQTDEIHYSHKNMTITIDALAQGECNIHETFWSSPLNNFVYRFPFVVGFGQDIIEIRLAVNGNLLCSMYMPAVKVLSSKEDIVFAVDRPISLNGNTTTSTGHGNTAKTHRSSFIRRENKEISASTTKRWDVYRISAAALQMNENKEHNENTLAELSPQLLRNMANNTERKQNFTREPNSQKQRSGSRARESDFHSTRFTDYSAPNTPLMNIFIDPFSDNDLLL
uniref:GTPase-activating Rap/Ran-GAP domain-like protein 3 n=2 Tax=Parascaris univalens TaxID=6257 RepID=A0A915CAG8_PARUN